MSHTPVDQTKVVNTSNEIQQHHLAAMVLEVSAPKAGNVHKGASFEDVTWLDFVASAVVTSPILARAKSLGVGQCIYDCVCATEQAVASNTNLGMLLLLAPLSAAAGSEAKDVVLVLDAMTQQDARLVYQAIAMANPGGLGEADSGDVNAVEADEPVMGLCEAMALAADRDSVAKQYANGFKEVFAAADQLAAHIENSKLSLDQAIVLTHLQLMAATPDTLIARKVGLAIAEEAAQRAVAVIDSQWPLGSASQSAFESLDDWLRTDGHQRNPGTSADLVAAALFVVLRQGKLELPSAWQENLWS